MSRLPTIAFCNDIDFADWAAYRQVHRELRQDFGLDLEDSFWIFDPLGSEMALFKRDLGEKGPRHDELLQEISAGRLTILHGGGNFDLNTGVRPCRSLLAEGLAYLREHACVPRIWTNHGDEGNIQNIGWGGSTYHQGDDPASDVYILDLLLQPGVRFFWTDRLYTHDFGCAPPGHRGQQLLRVEPTRAGLPIQGIVRYRGELRKAPDAETLGLQLTERNIDRLVQMGGDAVIYQHWCVHRHADGRPFTARPPVFPPHSREALARTSKLRDQRRLRVVRLVDLLQEHEAACRAEPVGQVA